MASTDRELPSSAATYPSLVAFYNADPVRLTSREQDVGLWWREGADGPLHRAAWVAETGEVYLVRLGPAADGGGAVEVLAKAEDPERLERMLSGWRQECGGPRSLQWLRRRTVRASPRVRRPRSRMTLGAGPMLI
ncbi:MAG TPA: hypothetical protein VH061_04170 [Solirubrobacteraceae bacterium]|jgi:hypothetical protein|nr:hypothetical protein [Solirubrobacteraceae bacterium]